MILRSREETDPVLADDCGRRTALTAVRGFGGVVVAVLVVQIVVGDANPTSHAVDVLLALAGFLTGRSALAAAQGDAGLLPPLVRGLRVLLAPTIGVLAVVLLAAAVALPSSWWPQLQAEAVVSVLFVQNWYAVLLAPATAPNGMLAGPLAHLWLVAVLGQLVVALTLLVGLAGVLARRSGWRRDAVLAVLLLIIAGSSVAWGMIRTADAAPLTALDTAVRAWPFAAGGALALAGGSGLTRSPTWAGLLLAVGLGAVAATLGSALAPAVGVLGALAVLHALDHGRPTPLSRVLASTPLRALSSVSIPLYLWVGAVLSFYLLWRERPEVGARGAAGVLGTAVLMAVASVVLGRGWSARRRRRGVGRVRPIGLAVAALVLVTIAWHGASTLLPGAFVDVADRTYPGAAARLPGHPSPPPAPVLPGPATRAGDWASAGSRCRTSALDAALQICGEPAADPTFRVVAVGDSHVEQLLPALRPVIDERRGELVTMLRGACPFSTTSDTVAGDTGCLAWNRAAMAEIQAMRPALVVTLASRDARSAATEETPEGFVDAWRDLDRAGVPVLAVRDNPRLPFSPTDCVDARPADLAGCAAPRAQLVATEPPWARAGPLPSNVGLLDLSDAYCTEVACPAVIGNVLVHLDTNHVSATFGGTLAPFVTPAVLRAVEQAAPGY